jgi:hypothetical protein
VPARILPWIAHIYTATGAVIALLATGMAFAHNFRAVFIYFIARPSSMLPMACWRAR